MIVISVNHFETLKSKLEAFSYVFADSRWYLSYFDKNNFYHETAPAQKGRRCHVPQSFKLKTNPGKIRSFVQNYIFPFSIPLHL